MSSAPRRNAPKVTAISGSVVTMAMKTVPTKLRDRPAATASWSASPGSQLPAASTTAADTPKRHQARRATSRSGSCSAAASAASPAASAAIAARIARSCPCTLRSASRYKASSTGLTSPEVQDHRVEGSGQQAQRRQPEQHHAEGGRQQVRRAGVLVDRLTRLHGVDDDQEQQIEHAGPERIADRQVGRVDQRSPR